METSPKSRFLSKTLFMITFSLLVTEMNAVTFFKTPYKNLVLPKQLQEYTIINIEPIEEHERHKFAGQGAISKKV